MTDEFEIMAKVYEDMIDWESRLQGELPFFDDYFTEEMRLIDLACATGRHAVEFAKNHEVVGVDISNEMISQARSLATKRGVDDNTTFYQADLSEIADDLGPFDAGYILANSLSNLADKQKIIKVLSKLRNLIPNGILIGQTVYLADEINYLPLRFTQIDNNDVTIQRIMMPIVHDKATHQLHFNVFKYGVSDYIEQKTHYLYNIRPDILEELCQETGWKIREIYSNYNKDKVDNSTGKAQIWILE